MDTLIRHFLASSARMEHSLTNRSFSLSMQHWGTTTSQFYTNTKPIGLSFAFWFLIHSPPLHFQFPSTVATTRTTLRITTIEATTTTGPSSERRSRRRSSASAIIPEVEEAETSPVTDWSRRTQTTRTESTSNASSAIFSVKTLNSELFVWPICSLLCCQLFLCVLVLLPRRAFLLFVLPLLLIVPWISWLVISHWPSKRSILIIDVGNIHLTTVIY